MENRSLINPFHWKNNGIKACIERENESCANTEWIFPSIRLLSGFTGRHGKEAFQSFSEIGPRRDWRNLFNFVIFFRSVVFSWLKLTFENVVCGHRAIFFSWKSREWFINIDRIIYGVASYIVWNIKYKI